MLAPLIIAATLLMLAAFPFHYLPRWVFCLAALAVAFLSNLIIRETLLAEANRKIREIETELLSVKVRLENSN